MTYRVKYKTRKPVTNGDPSRHGLWSCESPFCFLWLVNLLRTTLVIYLNSNQFLSFYTHAYYACVRAPRCQVGDGSRTSQGLISACRVFQGHAATACSSYPVALMTRTRVPWASTPRATTAVGATTVPLGDIPRSPSSFFDV
jgi:hypothetical protein